MTLLYAGFSALAQNDIKRALAYSTISQVGYMFLALGVAAWSAAIFHFMTHAFFKALLFLAAGLVIKAMDEEHDIRKMGGLRRDIPVVFWLFLIGAASLSALPLVTAGFYSKDLIIDYALWSRYGSGWLWAGAPRRSAADLALRLPAGLPGVLRRAAHRVTRLPRWPCSCRSCVLASLAVIAACSGCPAGAGLVALPDFLHRLAAGRPGRPASERRRAR